MVDLARSGSNEEVTFLYLGSSPSSPTYRVKTQDSKQIDTTNIGSYPELNPWNIIHILGFITPKFLLSCVMIIAALAIFQAWICVRVGIGKLLKWLRC